MQRKLTLLSLALALMAAPVTFAHDDQGGPGTPDFTCQVPSEWAVHDYAGANGRTVAFIADYNLEECGTTYGLFIAGTPECRQLVENGLDGTPAYTLLCQTDRPADYDGDLEHAVGGALLAVTDGDGATSGSLVCLGTEGHHPLGGPIWVQDQVFADVVFRVGADHSLVPVPDEPDCGDNVTRPCTTTPSGLGPEVDMVLALLQSGACNPNDALQVCQNSCNVGFGPGAEGTYIVWVYPALQSPNGNPTGASHGHIGHGTPPPPPPPLDLPECSNFADDSDPEDTVADWPNDPGCDDPLDDDETNNGGGPGVPFGGAPAAFLFNSDGSLGQFIEGPGWDCGEAAQVGGEWVVDCSPTISNDLVAASHPVVCRNPAAHAGGTLITAGSATARVACWTGFGFAWSGTCTATWVLAGGCVSQLPGVYHFPLRCAVSSGGVAVLGQFYAFCANDP